MTDESPPDVQYSASGRELGLAIARPADLDGDVFVDLSGTVAKLKALMERIEAASESILIFIRAPVESGKTTLVKYLTTKHSDEFVSVRPATSAQNWYRSVIKASGLDPATSDVADALQAIAATGKTIVIDEAHCLFAWPEVVADFFKFSELNDPAPRYLLFSASGSAGNAQGKTVATPGIIRHKYLWYPPNPDADELRYQLADAKQPVLLDAQSVEFFVRLCGGHRGIFMLAMKWVQECQSNEPQRELWTIKKTVSHVRKTFEDSRKADGIEGWDLGLLEKLQTSRAVRVNGDYSELDNIPQEFGFVLFGGPKVKSELNKKECLLTINGFLFPQRRGDVGEFVEFNWEKPSVLYGIPNPMMAWFYSDILQSETKTFKRKLIDYRKKAVSAADLLTRVLPYMTFTAVVQNPINRKGKLVDSLSTNGLPFEDDYNGAISAILRDELKYSVSNPQNIHSGKTDIVVNYDDGTTCAIESIMAKRDMNAHREHAERFLPKSDKPKPNYSEANQKALLIIGDKRDTAIVQGRVKQMAKEMKGKEGSPEIVGICVSLNHDSYEMYLEEDTEPLFFVCDRVAKCLTKDNRGRFEPAQACASEQDEQAQKKPRAN